MSIYRRKYRVKTKAGVIEPRVQKWFTIEVRHPTTGRIVRRHGPRDRKAAKVMEAQLLTDLERGQVGLLDAYREHRAEPINKVISAYIANMQTEKKDAKYIETTQHRLLRIVRECNWKTIYDASVTSFQQWRTRTAKAGFMGKPTSGKTLNDFQSTLNTFFKWCRRGRIDHNPVDGVEKVRVLANDRYRRAASHNEIVRFMGKLPADMRSFYTFLAYTALRRGSLEALKWEDLRLTGDRPAVIVRAASNKPRVNQEFPLRRDVSEMLRSAGKGKKPGDLVFKVPSIKQHKEYLAAAGIEFKTNDGRLDLHAFRKTLQMWMEDAGVDVREASKALGHLHLSTTLKNYRVKREGKAVAGVEKLPRLLK